MKFQKSKIKRLKNSNGFSLVEVIISVFLVAVGLIAVISLLSGTLSNSIDSRNQVIAVLLAQEGTELVRNIRDNNWESNDPPATHSFDNITNYADCTIDYVTHVIEGAPASHILKINGDGFYAHSGLTNTKFQRKIIISDELDINGISTGNKIIDSLVIWGGSVFPAVADCNTTSKCAYSQLALSIYGE
jgi:type II secretory pathway pseudopilin PulG